MSLESSDEDSSSGRSSLSEPVVELEEEEEVSRGNKDGCGKSLNEKKTGKEKQLPKKKKPRKRSNFEEFSQKIKNLEGHVSKIRLVSEDI